MFGAIKNMVRLWDNALSLFGRKTVDGNDTSLWYDPSLNGAKSTTRLGLVACMGCEHLKVSSIIQNGIWKPGAIKMHQQWN